MSEYFLDIFLYGKEVWILLTYRLVILTILEDATVGTLVVVEEVPILVVQLYAQHLYQPVEGPSDNHIYTYI